MLTLTTKTHSKSFQAFPLLELIEPEFLIQQKITKREKLLNKGSVCNKIFIVKKGLIKQYIYKENKKKIQNYFRDGDIAMNPDSYLQGKKSEFSLVAVPGSEIIILDDQILLSLDKKIQNFQNLLTEHFKELEKNKMQDSNFLLLLALFNQFEN